MVPSSIQGLVRPDRLAVSAWARDPAKRLRLNLLTFVAYVPLITCFAVLSESILLAALAFRCLS